MSDYLSNLVARTLNLAPVVRPRLAPLFGVADLVAPDFITGPPAEPAAAPVAPHPAPAHDSIHRGAAAHSVEPEPNAPQPVAPEPISARESPPSAAAAEPPAPPTADAANHPPAPVPPLPNTNEQSSRTAPAPVRRMGSPFVRRPAPPPVRSPEAQVSQIPPSRTALPVPPGLRSPPSTATVPAQTGRKFPLRYETQSELVTEPTPLRGEISSLELEAVPGAPSKRATQWNTATTTQPTPAVPAIPVETRRRPLAATAPEPVRIETPPTIQVTIGRIEVRAAPASQAARPAVAKPSSTSLDEYQKRRARGGRA